jgi:hypothetical protein
MSTVAEVWRDAMYEAAKALWPDLTPHEFGEAARAWLARQSGTLSVQAVATGIEQELTARYGPPRQP